MSRDDMFTGLLALGASGPEAEMLLAAGEVPRPGEGRGDGPFTLTWKILQVQ